jgi:hypothetical protein
MFLFNIFKACPELCDDFSTHTIMDGFIKQFPFMFFGGQGSHVALHYDIDMSHVFLNQIYGRKRVVLFSQEQSKLIYQHPYTVASYIDVNNPDYQKYLLLKKWRGMISCCSQERLCLCQVGTGITLNIQILDIQ